MEGYAVAVVLHDLNLAARYGHRMVVLAAGQCVAEGLPQETLSRETLRTAFGLDAEFVPLESHGGHAIYVHGERPGHDGEDA